MSNRWYIWSIEHAGWWKPNSRGYTEDKTDAGVYTFAQACKIVENANKYPKRPGVPNEAMIDASSEGKKHDVADMTPEEHKERHVVLHQSLDELSADFIRHTGRLPSSTPLIDLMTWSHEQTLNPTSTKSGI